MTDNKRIQYIKECYDLEMQRANKVDKKATSYIVMLGVTIAIFANVIIQLLHGGINLVSPVAIFSLISLNAIIMFIGLAMYNSIKVVSRSSYCYINPADVHSNYKEEELETKLCDDYKHAIKYNQKSTNAKVDSIVKAQKYMLVAIILILAYVIIASISYPIASYMTL